MRPGPSLLAALVVVSAAALWYRHARSAPIVDVTPRHPQLVDIHAGTYRGVILGAPLAEAIRVLGPPPKQSDYPYPIGAPPDAIAPSGPGSATSLDYQGLAVVIVAGRVRWIDITSPDAQTALGVGVGDSLAIARRAYPHLRCYAHDSSTDEGGIGPPFCDIRFGHGVNLELIGDPILAVIMRGSGTGARWQG